jgi:hypothetical protein
MSTYRNRNCLFASGEAGEEGVTLVGSVGRMRGCFIVHSENIQLLGIKVYFQLLSQHTHQKNDRDNDFDSDLTDTSELAQPLAE